MRELPNPFEWLRSDRLTWPASDTKLKLIHSWVVDVDHAVQHCKHRRLAVQAGGACGIWPARLADYFDSVYTFEPHPENFDCLVKNCAEYDNITAVNKGLSSSESTGALTRDEFEEGNSGAWYVTEGEGIELTTIDAMGLSQCDLIMLDVEGYELQALIGAVETIVNCSPVIVVEAKRLPHMKGKPETEGFLCDMGYSKVAQYHNDIVYQPAN